MKQLVGTVREALRGYWAQMASIIVTRAAGGLIESAAVIVLVPLLTGSYLGGRGLAARFPALFHLIPSWPNISPAAVILTFLSLEMLSQGLRLGSESLQRKIVFELEYSLRLRLFRRIVRVDWQSFVGLQYGRLSELVLARGSLLANFVGLVSTLLREAAVSIVYLAIAVAVSPTVSIGVFLFLGLVAPALWWFHRRVTFHANRVPQVSREMAEVFHQSVDNMKFVKSAGATPVALRWFDQAVEKYASSQLRLGVYQDALRNTADLGALLIITGVLFAAFGARLIPLSQALALLALTYRFVPRAQAVLSLYSRLKALEPSAGDLLQYEATLAGLPAESHGTRKPSYVNEIRFEGVGFAYRSQVSDFSLKGLDFVLPKGRCLAIVGESGVGKSTIVDLLTALCRPQSGRILIDGVDLSELDPEAWRAQVGLVLQDTPMFSTTVAENIAWASDEISLSRVEKAARTAGAWEFISRLTDGLNTSMGHDGLKLSGGQQQRIALARALYHDPALLILDEATSALDSIAEESFRQELLALKGKLSIIIIAHRLSTVRMADEIIVLQQGSVAERGDWKTLAALPNGHFSRLAKNQSIGPL